jgi:acyl-CoA reductase-like NAD-dependent aldehyde dehydrogenase
MSTRQQEKCVSRVPCSTLEELEGKLQKSKDAWESWSNLESTRRIELLREGLLKLKEEHERLVQLIRARNGEAHEELKKKWRER